MFSDLAFTVLDARFRVVRDFRLPVYTGSAIRGAWGHALRRVRPRRGKALCTSCPIRAHCRDSGLASYLLDSRADHPFLSGRLPYLRYRLDRYPAPFILRPPPGGIYRQGEVMSFNISLVGRAIGCVPFVVCSLDAMAYGHLARVSQPVRLEEVVVLDPVSVDAPRLVFAAGARTFGALMVTDWTTIRERAERELGRDGPMRVLELDFTSPLRLKDHNRLASKPDFSLFMRSLLRRMTLLSAHSPLTVELPFEDLLARAESVEVDSRRLYWSDWARYSSRQRCAMRFGGFSGIYRIQGELDEFYPFLQMGRHLHVGKQASFGLGSYHLKQPLRRDGSPRRRRVPAVAAVAGPGGER